MSTVSWRRFLLAFCALALIQLGVSVWMTPHLATMPGLSPSGFVGASATETGTKTPFVRKLSVPTSSPAYRAGLRSGDLVDLRKLSSNDRYRWFTQWWSPDDRVQLPVTRGNSAESVLLTAQAYPISWDVCVAIAGNLWTLLFAGIIAWRRSDSAEARVLALLLILFSFGLNFQSQNWITPWPAVDASLNALSSIFYYTGIALLATYALLFAPPATSQRRVLTWLAYTVGSIGALYHIARVVGTWTSIADPAQAWTSGPFPILLRNALPGLLALLCVGVAITQTRGAERARLSWATASLGPFYILVAASDTVFAFDHLPRWLLYAVNVASFLAPLGLTYSLLNRRLLDIGFTINRALVYSSVSVVVVGIFVLAEWTLSEAFRSASHTASLAINAVLALALGLSVRAIHYRVNQVFAGVFFRKRHEDENAIRDFAHEAAYVTDARILAQRAKETLEVHADASFVTIALADGAGLYGDASENDPVIVALRAWRKVLDLSTLQTDFKGEFAYPMIARGRLVGALVLGPKRSGESYAPDESDAIMQLARGVAAAFDVLSAKSAGSNDGILEAIRALPDAIVERLRATERRPANLQ